ncbi:hypothetical protein OAJ94_05085 [Deltaproteobacteria bacterium]|nr:hypothetical protein [Deltaproteobacteria bacterium]
MSEVSRVLEPLEVQKKAWTQRQLHEQIISRFFDVIEDLGDPIPTWLVRAKIEEEDIEDPHSALLALNEHLKELGWMAKLLRDDPWKIIISRIPPSTFIIPESRRNLFWLATLLSTWAMGVLWVLPQNEGSSWSDPSMLQAGLLSYAIPMVGVLALADKVQQNIANKMGMRVGGIMPIPIPLPMVMWPFGIFAVASSPKMDTLTWPDRRRLGWISIFFPIILLSGGLLLIIIGLWLTPVERVIDGAQNRLSFGLLPQLIASMIWQPEILSLKSAWSHPLALAGHGLMLIGWLSLLPIPSFPGGRILVALSGLDSARSQGTQMLLFFAVVSLGILLGGFSVGGHAIWSFVVITGGLLIIFQGSIEGIPLILDDVIPLEESAAKKMSMIFMVALLLCIPSELPTQSETSWDSDLDWFLDDEIIFTSFNESDEYSIEISNPGLLNKEWNIQGQTIDSIEQWNVSWLCPNGNVALFTDGCQGWLSAEQSKDIELIWQTPPSNQSPLTIELELLTKSASTSLVIRPEFDIVLVDARWNFTGDQESPVLCTELEIIDDEIPFNLTLISQKPDSKVENLWSIQETSEDLFCISGEAGAMFDSLGDLRLKVQMDDGRSQLWAISEPLLEKQFIIPESGWVLRNEEGKTVNWTDSGNWSISGAMDWKESDWLLVSSESECPDSGVWRQPSSNDTGWNWDSEFQSRISLPNLNSSNLSWNGEGGEYLLRCNDIEESWRLVSGHAVIMHDNAIPRMDWLGKGWLISSDSAGEMQLNFSDLEGGLVFDTRSHGNGSGWLPISLDVNGPENQLTISWQQSDNHLLMWLEMNENTIEVHLTSWILG